MNIAIVLILAAVVVSIVVLAARAQGRRGSANEDVTRGLRNQALTMSPTDLGFQGAAHEPYVVIMDIGYPKATASVMASTTGDASIYISSGGGVIGGVAHQTVRNAAKALFQESARYLNTFRIVSDFPYPGAGSVRFYVRIPEGVSVSQEIAESELVSRDLRKARDNRDVQIARWQGAAERQYR